MDHKQRDGTYYRATEKTIAEQTVQGRFTGYGVPKKNAFSLKDLGNKEDNFLFCL